MAMVAMVAMVAIEDVYCLRSARPGARSAVCLFL